MSDGQAGAPKGGKWNVMEIHAKGDDLTVKLNGVVTAHARDGKFKQGPISLQFGNLPKAPGGPPVKRRYPLDAFC